MRRFENFLNNENIPQFKTYMPIQLDGTCNGFQHLAMLSNETKLFETLNLYRATKKDEPRDFYQTILDTLILHLNMKVDEMIDEVDPKKVELRESYERLLAVGLTRKIVKPGIMNKPYNATIRTLISYVKASLTYHHTEEVRIKNSEGEIESSFKRG
jgi:DNA-directed RNA polymerase